MKREEIFNKFGGRCAYCGDKLKRIESMTVDHIIPRYNFSRVIENRSQPDFLKHLGAKDVNHPDNLFPSCRFCNKKKDTYTLEQFRWDLSEQLERAKKYSVNYRTALRFGQVKETPSDIIFYFEKHRESPKY